MEKNRASVKVTQPLLDWLHDDVLKSNFPIKTKSQFVTLCSKYWWKLYENADGQKQKEMMKEMQELRNECESTGLLQNSREIDLIEN